MTRPQHPEPRTPDTIEAHDGRAVAFTRWGASAGVPVLLHHGMPGTGADFEDWHPQLAAHGLQGIAIDRPGMGFSDRAPGRRLLTWPSDVASVMDALRVDRFTVLGVSGGGPHALAVADRMPERVVRCVLVSTGVENGTPGQTEGMATGNALAYRLLGRFAVLAHLQAALQDSLVRRRPALAARLIREAVGPADAELIRRLTDDELLIGLRRAARQGSGGIADEILLHARAWQFSPTRSTVPVTIWHGAEDRLSPASGARALAALLPNAELHILEGRGHLLEADHRVRESIIDAMAPPRT